MQNLKAYSLALRALLLCIMLTFDANAVAEDLPKGIIVLDGHPAPALKLSNMDGEAFDLAKYRGQWLVIHFWASWCGPCRREMPTINETYKLYDESKLRFVLVNTAESEDIVFNFIGIAAPDMIPLMDRDGAVTERWQPRGLPASFFVDPKGHLRYLALGGRDWRKKSYRDFLNRLVAKTKK